MGTNYYLRHETVPAELHIGKSSFGWAFALHVIPEKGISSLADWERLFDAPGWKIVDECDDQIGKSEMLDVINRTTGYRNEGCEFMRHDPNHMDYQYEPPEMRPTIVPGENYDLYPGHFS